MNFPSVRGELADPYGKFRKGELIREQRRGGGLAIQGNRKAALSR
jgi:hypothetical protein